MFNLLPITLNPVSYAFVNLVLCVTSGGRTKWAFVPFAYPLAIMRKEAGEWPTQWHRCFIKRTEA